MEQAEGAPPTGHSLLPGLTVGGYGTVQFLCPCGSRSTAAASVPGAGGGQEADAQFSRRARLDLSHLSGIAWWEPGPAWKILGEVDLQDIVQLPRHEDGEDGSDSSSYVALDRLYADYRFSDSLTVRAGKFLTPIGRWNQEHSDPLVWTVLRPLLSESAFPTSATGAMALGSLPVGQRWIDYQLYVSGGGEWRANPHTHRFEHGAGGRVSTELDTALQLGASVSRFVEDADPATFDLAGVDATLDWKRLTLSGEAIVRRAEGGAGGVERGWFLQSVVALDEHWSGVARLEAYRRAGEAATSRTGLVGAVYRSGRHWVFKVEWAQPGAQSAGLPAGLLSSLTLSY